MMRNRRVSTGVLALVAIVFPDDVHDSLLYKRWLYTFDRTSGFIGRFIGAGRRNTTTAQQ